MQPATVNGIITRESLPQHSRPPTAGATLLPPIPQPVIRSPLSHQPNGVEGSPCRPQSHWPLPGISTTALTDFPRATPLPKTPATPPLSATLAGMALDSARLLI